MDTIQPEDFTCNESERNIPECEINDNEGEIILARRQTK